MPPHLPELVHFFWMSQALALAKRAGAEGEIPVGALVVHHPQGMAPRIIGEGFNQREAGHDPTGHAEMVAIREAGETLGQWRLLDCTLYVTLEPCPMCAGALVQARLARLVYGCRDPKAGAVDSLFSLCTDPRLNHRLEVISDILAEQSAVLLQSFFANRRGQTPNPKPQPQSPETMTS